MPLNLSFSCWFFFWLTRLERVFASATGWKSLYLNERASGAWLGIGGFALWISRRYLITVTKHVLGLDTWFRYDSSTRSKFTQPVATQAEPLVPVDDSKEPVRYRSAALMFLASLAIITLFCSWRECLPGLLPFSTPFTVFLPSLSQGCGQTLDHRIMK